MKHAEIGGAFHIYVDKERGEQEIQVLRAIVRASFETALLMDDKKEVHSSMPEEFADSLINHELKEGQEVVNMVEILGRRCVTVLTRVGPNHYLLCNVFRSVRGTPAPMLERANQILANEKSPTSQEFFRRRAWSD